jgi:exoribonuclease-2
VAAQIDDWAGRAGRRPLPAADPRAALQDPVQARQERARVQGRGRGQRAPRTLAPLDLLQQAGAIDSPTSSTGSASCSTTSPRAPAFRRWQRRPHRRPAAGRGAGVSIDDSQTTEIDDALSVQGLGSGTVVLGIHIAAPGLAISPAALDELGRAAPVHRLHAGLQDHHAARRRWCRPTRWTKGRDCPAVSLYVTLDEATLEIKASETKLERVPIAANLRHDQLDAIVTEAGSLTFRASPRPSACYPFAPSWPFYTAGQST